MNKLKYLLTWMLLLVVSHVMGINVTVDPIEIEAGKAAQLVINLSNTETNLTAYQMFLYLPDGVTVQKKSNGKYAYTINQDRHDGAFTVSVKDADGGSVLITCFSADKDVIAGTSGELIRLPLEVASTVTTSLQGSLKNIEFSDVNAKAYKPADVTFNLTLKKSVEPVTITADDKTMTYGDDVPTLTYKSSGAALNGTPSLSTTATKTSPVGTYPIKVEKGTVTNELVTYVDGTLTIEKASLTVGVQNVTITEGDAIPSFTLTYSGFRNGDTESNAFSTKPTATTTATSSSTPGTYPITISGGEAKNYSLTYTQGTLTIQKKSVEPVTITADNKTMTYGDDVPTLTYKSSGAALNGTPSLSTTATKTSSVGTYPIKVEKGTVTNEQVTYVDGTLTIEKAPLTVGVQNVTITEGDAIPSFTLTYSGFRNGDTESNAFSTKPTATTTATSSSSAGTYPITISGGVATNYSLTYTQGTLTIKKKESTSTWTNLVVNSDLEGNDVSCFYKRENCDVDESIVPATITNGAGKDNSRGIVIQSVDNPVIGWNTQFFLRLTQSVPAGTKYRLSFDHKASQDADASTESQREPGEYNWAIGTMSFTTTWQHYESEETVTEEQSTMRTIAFNLTSNRKATKFYFDNIVFEIDQTQVEQSVTITADNKSMTYGDDVPTLTYRSSGAALNGTPSLSTTATKTSPVGTYPIKVEKGTVTNEQVTYVDGTLTIEKAPLTVGVQNVTITEGDAIPSFTLTYSGFRNGDTESNAFSTKPTATTTATSSSKAGTYPITISGGEAKNYSLTYTQGILTIKEKESTTSWANIVVNGDLEGGDLSCFYMREDYAVDDAVVPATIVSRLGTNKSHGILVRSVDNPADTWNTQFFVRLPQTIPAGTKYRLSFDYMASREAYVLMEIHAEPSEYIYYDFDHMTFNTTWQHYEGEGTITEEMSPDENKMRTIAFDLAHEKTATAYFFDNIVFEIDQAHVEPSVTITADNKTMTYGDNVPTLTYKSSGATLKGTPKLSTTATKTSPVGTYPIKVEKGTVTNEQVNYVDGTLTITKADLTVGVQDVTITEGDAIPSFTLTYSGWRNSDSESNAFTTKPTAKTTATSSSKAGTYPITVSGGSAKNYALTYKQGTLTIKKKDSTSTWTNLVVNSDLEGNDVSCFYKRENCDVNDNIVPATITNGAGKDNSRGIVIQSVDNPVIGWNTQFFLRLTQSVPAGTKYRLSFDHKASQDADVSTESQSEPGEYNWAIGTMSFTTSWQHYESEGTVTEEQSTNEKMMRTIAFNVTSNRKATKFYFDNIVFEIYQAQEEQTVTITADNKSMTYGDNVPTLTYKSSGAKLNGTPKLSTTATKTSPVGTYPIKVEKGTVTNEQVTYVDGTLTIEKAPLTVGVQDVTITEGDAIPSFTLTYSGFRNSDKESNAFTSKPTAKTTATSSSKAGTYPITVSGGSAKNYSLTYKQGTLTIKAKDTPVTWTNIVTNGNLEGSDLSCFYMRENYAVDDAVVPATIVKRLGKNNSRGIMVRSVDNPADTWNTQFFVRLPQTIPAGIKYRLSFDYKATQEAYVLMEIHAEPSEYIYYDFDHMTFNTTWQHYEGEGIITGEMSPDENMMRTIAFDLAHEKKATTYYFDNIVFEIPSTSAIKTVNADYRINTAVFNLSGQKLSKPQKGINIINGKKVVVK